MQGFFRNELAVVRKPKQELIDIPVLRKAGCSACSFRNCSCITPRMLPTGSKNPIIYFLGEAPGLDEDNAGEPFIGRSGRVLRAGNTGQLAIEG